MGTVLGTAAVEYDRKYATQAPSYGTETRGSPTMSQVVISSTSIGYPGVRQTDILVAMTQTALNQHSKNLSKEAIVFVDPDLVKSVPSNVGKVGRIPATKLSEESLGSRNYANTVMLGALIKSTRLVSIEGARNAIRATVPRGTIESNLRAFELGVRAIQNSR